MPAHRPAGVTPADLATFERAEAYRRNIKQLCDGDLTHLERKQAEQRIIEELA